MTPADASLTAGGLVSCVGAVALVVVPSLGWFAVIGTPALAILAAILAYVVARFRAPAHDPRVRRAPP